MKEYDLHDEYGNVNGVYTIGEDSDADNPDTSGVYPYFKFYCEKWHFSGQMTEVVKSK